MTLADWPQLVMGLLMSINLATHFVKDGQPKNEKYSFKVCVIGTAISVSLMYAGGFWH